MMHFTVLCAGQHLTATDLGMIDGAAQSILKEYPVSVSLLGEESSQGRRGTEVTTPSVTRHEIPFPQGSSGREQCLTFS